MTKEKCCYYGKDTECEVVNDITTPTTVNICVGPIVGTTPAEGGGCLTDSDRMNADNMECGSIVQGVNINRIQIESIYFRDFGSLPIEGIIYDPPFYCKHRHKHKEKLDEKDNTNYPILPGCPKCITINVPPNCKSFMISVLAFRNFRYGQQWNDSCTAEVDETDFIPNQNTSYRELYRFCWWIDITKNCECYPIFSLGPYQNYSIPIPTCFPQSTESSGFGQSNHTLTRWGIHSSSSAHGRCANPAVTPLVTEGQEDGCSSGTSRCEQPFYNTRSGGTMEVFSSTSDQCANYACGSNTQLGPTQSGNATVTPGFFTGMGPNISTICASFIICKKYNNNPCNPIPESSLANLNNNCCVSCLTLFAPCNFNSQ